MIAALPAEPADTLPATPPRPSQAVAKVCRLAGELCGRGPVHSPSLLAADMIGVRQTIDLLELAFSQMASEFATGDEYLLQGSTTPIDWIRHNCHLGGGAAADRVCVGDLLERLPASEEALTEGQIGFSHLALTARTAAAIAASPSGGSFNEEPLLARAREMSVGRFRHYCEHARHAADPEGYAAGQAAQADQRQLTLRHTEDGRLFLSGVLDSVGGATVRTALEPLARRQGHDDKRRRPHRLADALVELSTAALDSGRLPQRGGQRPHLQVTTTVETLLGLAGAPAAELDFSLPISTKTVQRLACDCAITRVLLNSESVVIDVGRAQRTVYGSRRRAAHARDRGCRFPGCDRPATFTELHHVVHWFKGGGNELDNLVCLCFRHHWMVHEGGWQLVRDQDSRLLVIPPPPFPGIEPVPRLLRDPARL